MHNRTQRLISQSGLNLIRIVIGSYFLATALDLTDGLNPAAVFQTFMDPKLAAVIGSTALFVLAFGFMVGAHLRLSALSLALFVLVTSVTQNIVVPQIAHMTAFWTDITLVCGVMLSYLTLKHHELGRASVGRSRRKVSSLSTFDGPVTPRRVVPALTARRRPIEPITNPLRTSASLHHERARTAAVTASAQRPTAVAPFVPQAPVMHLRQAHPSCLALQNERTDEVLNIFSD